MANVQQNISLSINILILEGCTRLTVYTQFCIYTFKHIHFSLSIVSGRLCIHSRSVSHCAKIYWRRFLLRNGKVGSCPYTLCCSSINEDFFTSCYRGLCVCGLDCSLFLPSFTFRDPRSRNVRRFKSHNLVDKCSNQ